jgi:hypothetical protein
MSSVYFIQRDDGPIKIGISRNVPFRTIKSIAYDERGEVSAFTLLTLRKHFSQKKWGTE